MQTTQLPSSSNEDLFAGQGRKLFTGMILLAYIVTLIDIWGEWTPARMALWLGLGVVYAAVGMYGWESIDRGTTKQHTPIIVYFGFQIFLSMGIIHLSEGSNGVWLLPLPLVAQTAGDLNVRWTLAVSAVILIVWAAQVSVWVNGEWALVLSNTLFYAPALAFTAVLSRIAALEQRSRRAEERLTAELSDANRQLRQYALQVEELATSQERNRLAREIHDSLGHYLTIIHVQLEAAQTVMERDPEQARDALDKAQKMAQQALAETRRSISALRASPLDHRSLPEVVGELAAENQAAGIVTELQVRGTPRSLSPQTTQTLYRAAQEALTNVRKHARASRVDMVLDYTAADRVEMSVRDNGIGAATHNGGFGLRGLQERVQLLGGRLKIETGPANGFNLHLQLPITNPPTLQPTNQPTNHQTNPQPTNQQPPPHDSPLTR